MTAQAPLPEAWQPLDVLRPEVSELDPDTCADIDARFGSPVAIATIWSDLVSNRYKVKECLFSPDRCFVILTPAPRVGRPDRRLAVRKVRVLERILLGENQKAVALAMKVAPSTITLTSGECLRAMGVDCRTSRVPMPIVMFVHAAKNRSVYREANISEVVFRGSPVRLVSMPRPDAVLADVLSPAECAVARLLIEGKRHAEIAEMRETSLRTVANQLASGFHKVGVSGRADLVCKLVSGFAEQPHELFALRRVRRALLAPRAARRSSPVAAELRRADVAQCMAAVACAGP